MPRLPLEKIKHSSKVVNALTEPRFFGDLQRATSLDSKSLQKVLAQLSKNGYLAKTDRGLLYLLTDPISQEN